MSLEEAIAKQFVLLSQKPDFNIIKTALYENHLETEETLKHITAFRSLKKLSKEQQAIIGSAMFLWAFEGLYTAILDTAIFILIKNGHDLYNPITREYAKTFDDLDNIDIFSKFRFLEEHGFKTLVRDNDRKIRNKIAHHRFKSNQETVHIECEGKIVEIFPVLRYLIESVNDYWNILYKLLGKQ